jgi:glycosyltransferase involved in cell wall biosynthesis
MNNNPKVSVIMSVYNGGRYIYESVSSILHQSYSDFEFIIIDDGSTDNTNIYLESINDSRLNIIHQDNKGLTASLNKAISVSKGEYIARQDADDISLPDRLEKQVEFLENKKDYLLVGSYSYLINENSEHIGIYKLPLTDTEIRWAILFRNPFGHSTVMMRSDILRKERIKYNESIKTAQDFELWSRIAKLGKMANIDKTLVKYRIHADQLCRLHNVEQQNNALLISRSNLENIGFHMSGDEVSILRKWAYRFPSNIQKRDLYFCEILFHILKTFKHLPFVDANNYKNIKKDLVWKYCNAISKDNLWSLLSSPTFIRIFYANMGLCCNNISRRFIKKLIH